MSIEAVEAVVELIEMGAVVGNPAIVKCLRSALDEPQQRTWVGLTDEDRQAAFESMPDMLDGFLKKWGWLHFSKALEAKLKEKNT
jgi:hypothetical protein